MAQRTKKNISAVSSVKPAESDELNSLFTTMLGICTLLEEKGRSDREITRYVSLLRGTVERANSLMGGKSANA